MAESFVRESKARATCVGLYSSSSCIKADANIKREEVLIPPVVMRGVAQKNKVPPVEKRHYIYYK